MTVDTITSMSTQEKLEAARRIFLAGSDWTEKSFRDYPVSTHNSMLKQAKTIVKLLGKKKHVV